MRSFVCKFPTAFALASLTACGAVRPSTEQEAQAAAAPTSSEAMTHQATPSPSSALTRQQVNLLAQELNLPIFWQADTNKNAKPDAAEVQILRFFPTSADWLSARKEEKLTGAWQAILARASKAATSSAPLPSDDREALVAQDLAQGVPTLLLSDFAKAPAWQKTFVGTMLDVASQIDSLYAKQLGLTGLEGRVAKDAPSQSLFRRNWGPACKGPKTEKNKACSAFPEEPRQVAVTAYPEKLQADPKFCSTLEARKDKTKLLTPFTVVREKGTSLEAVPYTEAYKDEMSTLARTLRTAEKGLPSEEAALKKYLLAAASSFETNNWEQADEAWAAMNTHNSAFYVRVAPDETYWEPCSQKAGFHLTFASINQGSLKWQKTLTPLIGEMENSIAALIGPTYKAGKPTFHLPDFIDIVVNAGDDRTPFGSTIGQSLPNWGKVANEKRGRTVAMTNLYTDADSLSSRRRQAESLFDTKTIASFTDDPEALLMDTILHEVTHNLGPAHEYACKGVTNAAGFGGELASMMEELKAQTGALYFLGMIADRSLITAQHRDEAYVSSMLWAFGHIARGMYTDSGKRKPYSQLAAIQVGFLLDEGVLTFNETGPTANGQDAGAFSVNLEKFPAAATKLMKVVATMKATNDRKGAEAMAAKYVDSARVPQALITERMLREPKNTFVYSVAL